MNAREVLPKVLIAEDLLEKIAQICVDFETEGHSAFDFFDFKEEAEKFNLSVFIYNCW